ncbi:DUF4136 domain-containing protein [Hydrocarboniclastica marina]|uniref:DUF4136 domain-containing protein n=2 Tax=Hydrocarboniclastica marina TaxID=2259620 RepID=A0A4P7XI03_9ALTE|nr:DUF4136 domain-containing protein [Hydrocarboniclastica marina]
MRNPQISRIREAGPRQSSYSGGSVTQETRHMRQMSGSIVMMALVALALTLSGCATNVVTDYDSQAPFASYESFAYEPGQTDRVQSLDDARVRSAVDEAMAEEGYEKTTPDKADLWVRFYFETKTKYESRGFTYGLGLFNSPFGVGLSSRPEARPVQQQQLFVELVDTQSKQVVWQGSAREYLTENMGPQLRSDTIRDLVANMFQQYPPGSAQ